MSEEIRTEELEVTETGVAEDVKEGLSVQDYGVIGGIMIAGIAAWELGRLGWRKTEKPRRKVKEFVTSKIGKNKKSKDAVELPEHEVITETVVEKIEEKKSEAKKEKSKK